MSRFPRIGSGHAWLALLAFATLAPSVSADGRLKVQLFDVGQGDAILVTCPDGKHQLLIDSGCNRYPKSQDNFRGELQAALASDPNRTIEFVVASHPHSDHIGGMAWVLTTFRVGTYIDNGRPHDTDTWRKVDAARKTKLRRNELKYLDATENSLGTLSLCPGVTIRLIVPAATARLSHPNDRSIAVRIDYQSRSFLFVGDMESHAERAWLDVLPAEARSLLDVDVLKVGHHGSDTSSSAAFVLATSPDLALVSCGARGIGTNTQYLHPRASTIRTYADWFHRHAPAVDAAAATVLCYDKVTRKWVQLPRPRGLWLTVIDGTVTVETDGTQFFVTPTT